MRFDHIIIDACSIMNFLRYYHEYYFLYNKETKQHQFKKIFPELKEFIVNKIKSGEIIVLDVVDKELLSSDLREFREDIKGSLTESLVVFNEVGSLIEKYRIIENEKMFEKQDDIDAELELYETRYADLYLIAYANKLKSGGKKVLLITEEHFGKPKKLLPQIPAMCKKDNENIFCRKLPFALFEYYKDELEFILNIK